MEILFAVVVAALLGGALVAYVWYARRRAKQRAEARKPRRRITQFEELKREFDELMPALYESDAAAQLAVGMGLNMSTAFFRSIYPTTKAFAAIPLAEQQDFLHRLAEAEAVFYEHNAPEAGMAATLVRYWLAAVAEGETEIVRELEVHLEYFSRKPLEQETSPARA